MSYVVSKALPKHNLAIRDIIIWGSIMKKELASIEMDKVIMMEIETSLGSS